MKLNSLSDVTFFVPGTPIPQGSKRAFVRGGRVSLVEANPKLGAWRKTVKLACIEAMYEVMVHTQPDQAFTVELKFKMPRPRTVTRALPTVKPDVDKLVRAILDSVTHAEFWADDSQVVEVNARKSYARSEHDVGVWVRIRHAE